MPESPAPIVTTFNFRVDGFYKSYQQVLSIQLVDQAYIVKDIRYLVA